MTCLATLLVAAMSASGLMSSPVQVNQRDGVNLEKLSRSALDGLASDEQARLMAEHDRLGGELEKLLGFSFGKPMGEYGFASVADRAKAPDHPVYALPKPVLAFERFRPLLLSDRLCGVLLERPLTPCVKEEDRAPMFLAADAAVRTNLVATLNLSTNDLAVAANGTPHLWRISLEHWRETQILRVADPELTARLARAIKAEREERKREQARHLMHADEAVKVEPKKADEGAVNE